MDIVEKLRNHAMPDPNDEREVLHAPLLKEAADEIERLRAILADCREMANYKNADSNIAMAIDKFMKHHV